MNLFGVTKGKVAIPKKKFTQDLAVKSFETKLKGVIIKGFVVFKGGKYYAYQNLCRHFPVTLDLNDENFFTHDKSYLQCHMHGATYEVETGFCTAGPCQGTRLKALTLIEEATQIIVDCSGAEPVK